MSQNKKVNLKKTFEVKLISCHSNLNKCTTKYLTKNSTKLKTKIVSGSNQVNLHNQPDMRHRLASNKSRHEYLASNIFVNATKYCFSRFTRGITVSEFAKYNLFNNYIIEFDEEEECRVWPGWRSTCPECTWICIDCRWNIWRRFKRIIRVFNRKKAKYNTTHYYVIWDVRLATNNINLDWYVSCGETSAWDNTIKASAPHYKDEDAWYKTIPVAYRNFNHVKQHDKISALFCSDYNLVDCNMFIYQTYILWTNLHGNFRFMVKRQPFFETLRRNVVRRTLSYDVYFLIRKFKLKKYLPLTTKALSIVFLINFTTFTSNFYKNYSNLEVYQLTTTTSPLKFKTRRLFWKNFTAKIKKKKIVPTIVELPKSLEKWVKVFVKSSERSEKPFFECDEEIVPQANYVTKNRQPFKNLKKEFTSSKGSFLEPASNQNSKYWKIKYNITNFKVRPGVYLEHGIVTDEHEFSWIYSGGGSLNSVYKYKYYKNVKNPTKSLFKRLRPKKRILSIIKRKKRRFLKFFKKIKFKSYIKILRGIINYKKICEFMLSINTIRVDNFSKVSTVAKKSLILFKHKKYKTNFLRNKRKKSTINNKRLHLYRKLKRVMPINNYSYFLNIFLPKVFYEFKKKTNIIFNCMYLNKHIISHYFVKLLKQHTKVPKIAKSYLYLSIFHDTKKNNTKRVNSNIKLKKALAFKHKKKKVYFFNSWHGLLVTWKQSRLVHWKLYRLGTLKKNRYRLFLPPFLRKNKIATDIIVKYFSFKFQLSVSFWKQFTELYLFFFNKKLHGKQIFQIPINLVFWVFLIKIRKDKHKLKLKIKSWLYKKRRISKTFWMDRKKKTPKIIVKQVFYYNQLKNAIHYDFITNYFSILKACQTHEKLNEYIFKNKMLKMNNFRYKA